MEEKEEIEEERRKKSRLGEGGILKVEREGVSWVGYGLRDKIEGLGE